MNKDINACFTRNSDDWATPTPIYSKFLEKGFIDPCPYKSTKNGFGVMYQNQRIYINPPFSQNKLWVKYAVDLALRGNDVWLLIAVRTDTQYFRFIFETLPVCLYFISGRISFNDKGHAPFPVMFIHLTDYIFNNFYLVGNQDEFIEYLDQLY